jgi:hypothetical protein
MHPVQSLHSSPKAVLKEGAILQMERKLGQASDSIGDGLRVDTRVATEIANE